MTIIGEGMRFIARFDTGAYDYTKTGLTADGAWHTLDYSAIVPLNAKAFYIKAGVQDDLIDQYLQFRGQGDNTTTNRIAIYTQVADQLIYHYVWVPIVNIPNLQYILSNVVWSTVNIKVLGYYI